ncbi:MAG: hypothetical protein CL484_07590 [Acidobacteria bacterium]|nr:hypothetical protein [Acidobacteriota bacterium]|tara:strand:- start:803 stop:985 length:183 start_codon:yes stop_codon:yes gene_type:complete
MDAGVIFLVVVFVIYFLPMVTAILRRTANQNSVAIINIFLGWTFIGWVVALAMAVSNKKL